MAGAGRALVIVNDQPYGSERPYNALRLAGALSKREDVDLRVFLFGDAVGYAVSGQKLADGHYQSRRSSTGRCGRIAR